MHRRVLALPLAAAAALAFTGAAHQAPVDAAIAPAPLAQKAPRRYVVAPTGNEVRYRVREQLVGLDFPNDAVGKSSAITGGIAFAENGNVLSEPSKFEIDASTFVSDRDRRDNYLRQRLFVTDSFPTITFVPIAAPGLTAPFPTSGSRTFELVGNLTVRGVTRPTRWRATANFDGDRVTGSAITGFTFADIQLEKPRVRSVLSVADSIHLEYDFTLRPADSPRP